MYVGLEEIRQALPRLKKINPFFGTCFLAFKEADVPVGHATPLVFARLNREFLNRYYRPVAKHEGFFHPFFTSNDGSGWVSGEYARTSLQRIVHDTFRDAIIRGKDQKSWGWARDYVRRLNSHLDEPIPAFELAVWLFRERDVPASTSPRDLVSALLAEFNITVGEVAGLFNAAVPERGRAWLSKSPVAESGLLDVIGPPPGSAHDRAAALRELRLDHVGPGDRFLYQPAQRLNLLTGDNSLGKTFILECIWWALTGDWIERPAMPQLDAPKKASRISFLLSTDSAKSRRREASYDWDRHAWTAPRRDDHPGLAIYARFDGSFAVWDPARRVLGEEGPRNGTRLPLLLDRDELWNGKMVDHAPRREWICNGLIRDWVSWQTAGERYAERWGALTACLRRLSPSATERLEPSEPMRLGFESREIPTLKMPYGDVPIYHASAGVQRIVAIAYVLVWAWHEHLAYSTSARRDPQRRITILIDEIEAHLHPRWQRIIAPAVVDALTTLSGGAVAQIHLATHSPMVLASAEPLFDNALDALHHVRLDGADVVLEQLPFVRRGRVDLWLTSPVFGLAQARSLEAERLISEAVDLQRQDEPARKAVQEINRRLVATLAPDDGFWPRWRSFALAHGGDE